MVINLIKYVDVRNIINLQVHLLFLPAGVLEDKVREKGLVNVFYFLATHCSV